MKRVKKVKMANVFCIRVCIWNIQTVEITIRRGEGRKEKKGGNEPIQRIIHIFPGYVHKYKMSQCNSL
jgi:hypothetical protein